MELELFIKYRPVI